MAERVTGEVKWFNAIKGFGFITRDNGEDVFVLQRHCGDGYRSLEEASELSSLLSRPKGPQAQDVTPVPS